MLKWLRKYNTWIMVIAGSLLMVTFLLQQTLSDLGKNRSTGIKVKVNGSRVSQADIAQAFQEYGVLANVFRTALDSEPFLIQNFEHWYLLTRAAEESGFLAGPEEGRELSQRLGELLFTQPGLDRSTIAQLAAQYTPIIQAQIKRSATAAGMNEEQEYRLLGKLSGILRMKSQVYTLPRISDRRLTAEYRRMSDSVGIEYVLVPSDRETSHVARPDDAKVREFYEKYRDIRPGEGEFGVGYRQPPMVKIEWLTISSTAMNRFVQPDPIEVQKRFLKRYPEGQPKDGQTPEQAAASIDQEIRQELADKILRAADQAIRAEVDKALRSVNQVGRFWQLPTDWSSRRPTIETLAKAAQARMSDVAGTQVDPLPVSKADDVWQSKTMLGALPGIGRAQLSRGKATPMSFADVVLNIKELAGENALPVQVGLPGDPLKDGAGNLYYYIVTDARAEGPAISIDEVNAEIIRDIMQIEGFKRLQEQIETYRSKAVAGGLEALNIKDSELAVMQGVVAFATLTVNNADVTRERLFGSAQNIKEIDLPEVREAIMAAADKLDPTKPIADVAAEQRFVVVAAPKARGLVIAQIKTLDPVTIEELRSRDMIAAMRVKRRSFLTQREQDPFIFENMKKRYKFEVESRKGESEDKEDGEKLIKSPTPLGG